MQVDMTNSKNVYNSSNYEPSKEFLLEKKIEAIKTFSLCDFVSKQMGLDKFEALHTVQVDMGPFKQEYSKYKLKIKNDHSILLGLDPNNKSCFIEVRATGTGDDKARLAYRIYQLKDSKMWGVTQKNKVCNGYSWNNLFPKDHPDMVKYPECTLDLSKAEKYFSSIFADTTAEFLALTNINYGSYNGTFKINP